MSAFRCAGSALMCSMRFALRASLRSFLRGVIELSSETLADLTRIRSAAVPACSVSPLGFIASLARTTFGPLRSCGVR